MTPRRILIALTAVLALLGVAPAQARVTKLVVDKVESPAFGGQAFGAAGAYETIAGRAFGELDPGDARNAIIQDIALAKDDDGKVRYVATFFLVKPVDMGKSSGLLWHDVPNRGGRITLPEASRTEGDIGLSSGWQGDDSGATARTRPGGEWVKVPIARNADGSSITGRVLGRIVNRSGMDSQPMLVQGSPVPYRPASLDTRQATLVSRERESMEGAVTGETTIAPGDWAWAKCDATTPFPGTPDPTQICLRQGFDPRRLYQVVFTAKDPYALGVGFAAFRDVAAFFRTAKADDAGTPNPLAGGVRWSIARGVSQSGNFLRGFLHLGFNQDESGRRVHDGLWPIIAGRRIALNFRWAQPDGVLELYQAGSEGPQWWVKHEDGVRALPPRSIMDRCRVSSTCPKIIEHFGAAEIWALKLGVEWVGTDAKQDIALPDDVRRYYIASTAHGGGAGGFTSAPSSATVNCPGNNYGPAVLRANPLPHTQTVNALRHHFRRWVMQGIEPPPSVWPRLKNGELVAPTKTAMGFPTIPGLRATAPEAGFINPVLDYDWGPEFDPNDATGVPTIIPPRIRRVIDTLVPRVDADGNEVGGVPVVLALAPLGTYLGWNVTASGFHKDQLCNYAGGMIPFAVTKAERTASGDPRASLEERYGTHEGYVKAVQAAAAKAVAAGFLLQADAELLIQQARASDVLNP